MQKKYLARTIALILAFSSVYTVSASSPSPSPSPSSSPVEPSISEVTDNIKKRLQDNLESEPANTTLPGFVGYVGIVKDVIKDTVVIEDKDGKKDVKLNTDTTILRSPGNTPIKTESIRIDDYIIAIGDRSEEDTIIGRRLILSTTEIKPPLKKSGLGVVTKLTKSMLNLEVDSKEVILDTTTKTIVKSKSGSIELADIKVGDTLIYTATIDEKDNLSATVIMQITKK